MNFAQFVTTEFGTRLWMALGRWLPPRAGHAFTRLVTSVLARRKHSSLYRILYENQAGVLGAEAASSEHLDHRVHQVLRHAGFTAYDLMHLVALGENAIREAVEFGPELRPQLEAAKATGRGILVCGCHLTNFNLGFLSFALQNQPMQVLSSAAPVGGFRMMQAMRARGLLEETPIDEAALRSAIRRLRQGGVVVTGVDWPVPVPRERWLPFFGKPARLPTGHVRLAMSARAVLLPLACHWDPRRGYYVEAAPHLELELTDQREADIRHNACRVLAVLEGWIRRTPDQWLMYHPIWSEDRVQHHAGL